MRHMTKHTVGYKGIDLSVIADIRNAMRSNWPRLPKKEVEAMIDYMLIDFDPGALNDIDAHIIRHMYTLWMAA